MSIAREQMPFDVFISYSSPNKLEADAVCAKLEAANIRCWIAPRNILPGTEWGRAIIQGLEQSRVMVLIFSEHANGSPQVRREVERAVAKEIPIVPFRVENALPAGALEFNLSNTHWLDAFNPPLEKHIRELELVVRQLLQPQAEGKRPPTYTGARTDVRRSKAGVWAVVVVVALMIGSAFWIFHARDRKPLNSDDPTAANPVEPPAVMSPEVQDIRTKLTTYHIDKVYFERLPLSVIAEYFHGLSKMRDPDYKGVNFTVTPDLQKLEGDQPMTLNAVDGEWPPTTGRPGVTGVLVTVKPPLADVRMIDALDIVVRCADTRIKYSIENYGVVFSAK